MVHDYAVILAGGKGERFWPMSTSKRPKQLLALVGDRPLLAQSVERLNGLIPPERVLILTNADLVEATREAVPELPPENVIGEPMGRDTGPAVALACALVKHRDPEAAFCILTADHIIGDLPVFQSTLRESLALAHEEDVLITIGIRPSYPSTGFGYIEAGDAAKTSEHIHFKIAKRFVEKPDRETAIRYLESGGYLWNSGMFIWSVATLEDNLRRHTEELGGLMDGVADILEKGTFDTELAGVFEPLTKISIDYAVMEKAERILMAEGSFSWSDIGSWTAMSEHFDPDENGNTVVGKAITLDATGNVIMSGDRRTAVMGVDHLIVVQADDVTLVCPKDRAQDIKELVAKVRMNPDWFESV